MWYNVISNVTKFCMEGDWMMLTFIFKYTWVGMLIIGWIIWSISSIKDIIETARIWKDRFDLNDLNEGTLYWITMTLIAMFSGSLVYWIFGGAIE